MLLADLQAAVTELSDLQGVRDRLTDKERVLTQAQSQAELVPVCIWPKGWIHMHGTQLADAHVAQGLRARVAELEAAVGRLEVCALGPARSLLSR